MANIKRLGLLTGGGDCGGLEAAIRGVVFAAAAKGIEVIGIPNGYQGLYNLDQNIGVLLTPAMVDNRSKKAGTFLGTSRVKLSKLKDGFEKAAANLKKNNIDALLVAGGDDTSGVLDELSSRGIPGIWIPKTMDLDVVPYSVGGTSTINRIADFLYDLRTTSKSHNRITIVEVFGRYVGHTAFRGGVAGQADIILIPEIGIDFDIVYEQVKEKYMSWMSITPFKKASVIIVVSEGIRDPQGNVFSKTGLTDRFGHKELGGAGDYVRQAISDRLKEDNSWVDFLKAQHMWVEGMAERPEVKVVNPGHLVRCGEADAYDAIHGQKLGAAAVQLALNGDFGYGVCDVRGNRIYKMPIKEMREQTPVNLEEIAIFEEMGYRFGRKPVGYKPTIELISKQEIHRIY